MGESIEDEITREVEERVVHEHQVDSWSLLVFVGLLILTVLACWVMKHHRFRFIHESGLGVLFGFLAGLIIYAVNTGDAVSKEGVHLPTSSNYSFKDPPDWLDLSTCKNLSMRGNCTDDLTVKYRYKLAGQKIVKDGATVRNEEMSKATFDPEVFFNILLPPIIFNAGYSMKRRHFFKNFGAIALFAFLGTGISAFAVGASTFLFTRITEYLRTTFSFTDCLFFGSIISATDPVTVLAIFHELNVDVDLYALIFGESVLNDAVAIVLSGSVEEFSRYSGSGSPVLDAVLNFIGIFLGAFALGSVMACITALFMKFTKIQEHPLLETTLFCLMSYGTFLLAEGIGLTGIVAVLFCGIGQAHYTYNNLSKESQSRTKEFFGLLNFLAENFVFIYIGVSVLTFQNHKINLWVILGGFVGIIIGRLLNIYPLSFFLNLGRTNKIRYNFQNMMMFSGLRGAIAFALAIRNTSDDVRQIFFTTTLIIVIVTILCCGGLTTMMLQWLNIRVGVDPDADQKLHPPGASRPSYGSPDETNAAAADATTQRRQRRGGKAWLVAKWSNLDSHFVKPLLTHSKPTLMDTLPQVGFVQFFARALTTNEQLVETTARSPSDDSDVDIILDQSSLALEMRSDSNASSDVPVLTVETSEVQAVKSNGSNELPGGDVGLGTQSTVSLFGQHKSEHV